MPFIARTQGRVRSDFCPINRTPSPPAWLQTIRQECPLAQVLSRTRLFVYVDVIRQIKISTYASHYQDSLYTMTRMTKWH